MSIKIVANGKIEVNNVGKAYLKNFLRYIDSNARNSVSRTVPTYIHSGPQEDGTRNGTLRYLFHLTVGFCQ
jgi:hypothetical protein